MSKAALASLAKEIYEEAISKNIRKGTKGQNDGLDDTTHVFLINEATVEDGYGNYLGIEDETDRKKAISLITEEFKRVANTMISKKLNPSLDNWDSKAALQLLIMSNGDYLVIAKSYKRLDDSFLYKMRGKLEGIFDKANKYVTFTGSKGQDVTFKNILGTYTDYIGKNKTPNEIRYTNIGHTAAFGYEEKNTPLGVKLGLTREFANASMIPGAHKLSSIAESLIRKLRKIHAEVTVNTRKDLSSLQYLAANKNIINVNSFIVVLPQHFDLNQRVLGSIENKIYQRMEKIASRLKSSPTLLEMMWDAILSTFQTGKMKGAKYSNKATYKTDELYTGKIQGSTFSKAQKLRDTKGKFFSVLKLQNLINAQLHDRLKKNMGQGFSTERLNYRTGRFAKSAKVTAITPSDQLLTTYYTYMKYPYATFAPGGKQYRGDGRDPELLINMSIREIAIGLVSKQFKVVPKVV